ncbi:G8 domain-containing protein [Marinicellulosiphila megalodicopiae]|uniref:G8 domain-containing protein n=1 Tax=Marinicellulosiphila megalodicopiae TaxID=2724896 RepID=UPI003BB13B97
MKIKNTLPNCISSVGKFVKSSIKDNISLLMIITSVALVSCQSDDTQPNGIENNNVNSTITQSDILTQTDSQVDTSNEQSNIDTNSLTSTQTTMPVDTQTQTVATATDDNTQTNTSIETKTNTTTNTSENTATNTQTNTDSTTGTDTQTDTSNNTNTMTDSGTQTETETQSELMIPEGYAFIANEGDMIEVDTSNYSTVNLAYGASDQFVFLLDQNENVGCSNASFGSDPIKGVVKACYIQVIESDFDLMEAQALFKSKNCTNCHSDGAQYTNLASLIENNTLISTIETSMPTANPSLCVTDCAKTLAQYIEQTFYNVAPPIDHVIDVPANKIEAESYINAFDTTAENLGNCGPSDQAVDQVIINNSNGSECAIGYTQKDEWLEFKIQSKTSGNFQLELKLASANENKNLAIEIDGNLQSTVSAPSNGWTAYSTVISGPIALTRNKVHTLRLLFVEGGLNIDLFNIQPYEVPTVEEPALPAGFKVWSDPETWGGNVPANGSSVTITKNMKVMLDQNITLKSLQINGELRCAEQNLNITADSIMVHGEFTCGTELKPFTNKLNITLTGAKPANVAKDGSGMGTKLIGVMMGGVLNLHGQERTSWIHLDETAAKDAQQIVLSETTDWRAGDQLVITSTSQDYKQAETVTIEKIDGLIVDLKAPLKYKHFGEIQSYFNDTRGWDVNTRAEVGLLTRNIKIRGDIQSNDDKYGGHVMVMINSQAYLSGVEMDRMGQYGLKGRYPFHWHMVQDATGQFIKNSVIKNSYNRCITVHGTHNTVVSDNVCYKHVGHGIFLEDGIEQGNTFDHNLVLWATRPPEADALIPSDFEKGPASQGPASFWISNGNNTFTNNAAAGSDGLGYWYDTEDKVTGDSAALAEAKNYNPRKSDFAKFKDNTVHSSGMALSICSRSEGRPGYEPTNVNGALIENLTVYFGGIGAIWPCNRYHRFKNIKVLDTGYSTGINSKRAAFVSAFPAFIDDSLFVSNSKLAGSKPVTRAAFGIYDFGTRITNTHLVNYSQDNADSPMFVRVGGGVTFMYQGVTNLTRDNSDLMLSVGNENSSNVATSANVIRDYDGSISGKPGRWSITPKSPLMIDDSCVASKASKDDGVLCPYYYGQLLIRTSDINKLPGIATTRSDLAGVTKNTLMHVARKFYKVYIPLNKTDYHLELDFENEFTTGALKSLTTLPLSMEYGYEVGDTAMIALKNLKPTAKITKTGWVQVNSLNALKNHAGQAWFKSGNVMHIKFKTTSNSVQLGVNDRVDILF